MTATGVGSNDLIEIESTTDGEEGDGELESPVVGNSASVTSISSAIESRQELDGNVSGPAAPPPVPAPPKLHPHRNLTVQVPPPPPRPPTQLHIAQGGPSPLTISSSSLVPSQHQNDGPPTTTLSKLSFWSQNDDDRTVQTELSRLESQSIRRREEYYNALFQVERQVAALHARVAETQMQRHAEVQTYNERAYKSAQDLVDQVHRHLDCPQSNTGGDDISSSKLDRRSTLRQLWTRMESLDTAMTHAVHVEVQKEQLDKVTEIESRVIHQLIPDLTMEQSAADKKEGNIARRMEALTGTLARRLGEEKAARVAQIEVLTRRARILESPEKDFPATEDFLSEIRQVRQQVQQEREERMKHDAILKKKIEEATARMRDALLETFGEY